MINLWMLNDFAFAVVLTNQSLWLLLVISYWWDCWRLRKFGGIGCVICKFSSFASFVIIEVVIASFCSLRCKVKVPACLRWIFVQLTHI